jgi:type VI secretion system protein ImpC
MAESFALADVEGELVATMEQPEVRPASDLPFRVLLIGDWSGRRNRGLSASSEELKEWRPLLVDRDNLDQLMARLGVKLHIPLTDDGSQSLTITFDQLDDFHPDRLFDRLEIFDSLRRTRAKLSNPKTFAQAAAEMREWSEPQRVDESTSSSTVTTPADEPSVTSSADGENLLDQILAGGPKTSSAKPSQPTEQISPEIAELAKAAVKPYLSPDIEDDQDQLIDTVDARITGNMRAILHHSDFQAIESAWRGLDFLVMRLDTGTDLKLYLLDISLDELKSDLASHEDFRTSALYKLVVEQTVGTAGGIPWAVIAGNFIFDVGAESGAQAISNAKLIETISMIAEESGAPFVAGTTSYLLGCESLAKTPDPDDWRMSVAPEAEKAWNEVTSIASAGYVGLALPRFLVRLPFGKDTEPTEQFDFEEFGTGDDPSTRHWSYLWANPGFAIAYLLAAGFSKNNWDLRPSDALEIEGLPLHVYENDGDSEIKPCAEVLLTMRAAQKIIDTGLMPLLSMKDSDTIRLGMFQSIAGTRLRGRWDQ